MTVPVVRVVVLTAGRDMYFMAKRVACLTGSPFVAVVGFVPRHACGRSGGKQRSVV